MFGLILATLYACLMHYVIGRRMYHEEFLVVLMLPTFFLVYGCGFSSYDLRDLMLPETFVVTLATHYWIDNDKRMAQGGEAKDRADAMDLGWFHAQSFFDFVFHRTGVNAAWRRAHDYLRVRFLTQA